MTPYILEITDRIEFINSSIAWLFFNVIFAVFPVLFNVVLVRLGNIKTSRAELLKDGELYVFSTSISAASVGSILFGNPSNLIISSLTACCLMSVFCASSGFFMLASFTKLKKINVFDKQFYSDSSIACALITVFLSYIAFVQVFSR